MRVSRINHTGQPLVAESSAEKQLGVTASSFRSVYVPGHHNVLKNSAATARARLKSILNSSRSIAAYCRSITASRLCNCSRNVSRWRHKNSRALNDGFGHVAQVRCKKPKVLGVGNKNINVFTVAVIVTEHQYGATAECPQGVTDATMLCCIIQQRQCVLKKYLPRPIGQMGWREVG